MFLRRVILQTRSDGESQLLQSKALELERLLQTMPIAGELPLEEECPACKSEIPFRDVRTAACQNGHPWSEGFVFEALERFCLPVLRNPSSMLGHDARTCNFSGANLSWVYAQGVFPDSVWFRWSSVCGCRESVGGWSSAGCNPMFILWESFCILAVVPLTITAGNFSLERTGVLRWSFYRTLSKKNANRNPEVRANMRH